MYGENWYFVNFLLVCIAYYLFTLLIAIFGMIILYFIKKFNKKEWGLNFLEIFIIAFAIGLSVYISLCFILDIFMFFNFYSAYLSLIIIDVIFLLYLIRCKELTREKVANFITSIKIRFKNKPRDSTVFIGIVIIILIIQILIQWRIITQSYPIPSKDTYGALGHMYHLLERGYLWRERYSIQYPKGYPFFIVAPVLINPDFRFTYIYLKFGGIPIMSFYMIVMTVILKRIFSKNYLVFIGLMLTLISNILFSRFIVNSSSAIATVMILICFMIIRSKCPFYLTGFLVQIMFLFNPTFAFCYMLIWILFVIINLISKVSRLKIILIDYLFKPLILLIFTILSFIINTLVVQNITFIDLLDAFLFFFSISEFNINLSNNSNLLVLNSVYLFKDLSLFNDFLNAFYYMEERILSLFIIFAILGLFLPLKKYFGKKFRESINFGKLSLLVLIGLFLIEVFLVNSKVIIILFLRYVILPRAIEGFAGPIIIFCCFQLELIIRKAKIFTYYLKNKYPSYRNLLRNNIFSKFFRIENIIITMLLISVCSTFIVHREVYYNVYFEKDHIETIFYIKDNIPEDSKILVHFYEDTGDALHSLLSTYDLYDWEFSEGKNDVAAIKEYIRDKNIDYVLLDLETVSSIELYNFTSDPHFENLYENEIHMFFEYDEFIYGKIYLENQ